ncbi:hypothetical protein FYC51_09725 [Agromyces mariniharenae]|uniref:Uncharacterized protein n=1 Tax=Agromyces mariniharenae TaxID=2604423 RepID=A0A5S4VB75_9MICO|nr:hypothetical protein FYC51_09725 [Agromyces mariniharenae]
MRRERCRGRGRFDRGRRRFGRWLFGRGRFDLGRGRGRFGRGRFDLGRGRFDLGRGRGRGIRRGIGRSLLGRCRIRGGEQAEREPDRSGDDPQQGEAEPRHRPRGIRCGHHAHPPLHFDGTPGGRAWSSVGRAGFPASRDIPAIMPLRESGACTCLPRSA